MLGPAGKSSGVPLRVWRGRFSLSGSVALASSARTNDAQKRTVNPMANKNLDKSFFINSFRAQRIENNWLTQRHRFQRKELPIFVSTNKCWSHENAKITDESQPPMTFDLSLSGLAGSRSPRRLGRFPSSRSVVQ